MLRSKFVILSVVVFVASSLAFARSEERETETIEARDGSRVEAETFRVEVPEVRSKKGSRAISLAVMRVKSVVDPPGAPVFLLAGGPGGSAIENLRRHVTGGGKFYLELMGGDVVAIDQRGVGRSSPNLESTASFGLPLDRAWDPEADIEKMARVCAAEIDRVRALGVDLDGYDSVESADDIEAVRKALGYDKIALFAESYGTHLAFATIRRHEKSIERAVLFGAEGPDHTLKLPSYAQAGLERLSAIVRDDPVIGEEMPDLAGTLKKVLDDLESNPRVVAVDGENVGIGKFDVQWLIANQIGLVHEGATSVPARVAEMANGDFEGIANVLLEYRRDFGIGTVMGMVVDAASGASVARRKLIASEATSCILGDAVDWPNSALAKAWRVPDLGDSYRAPLTSKVPILFVIGDLDSRTPVRNAEELTKTLPNARLVVVENAGHDVNFVMPELRAIWSAFLRGAATESTRVKAPPLRFEAF